MNLTEGLFKWSSFTKDYPTLPRMQYTMGFLSTHALDVSLFWNHGTLVVLAHCGQTGIFYHKTIYYLSFYFMPAFSWITNKLQDF